MLHFYTELVRALALQLHSNIKSQMFYIQIQDTKINIVEIQKQFRYLQCLPPLNTGLTKN